jgi:hypothetical protein
MASCEYTPKYISEHIPKTGGTTLRWFYGMVFPKDTVYFYYGGNLFTAAESLGLTTRFPVLSIIKTRLNASEIGKRIYTLLRGTIPLQPGYNNIHGPCNIIHGHHAASRFRETYPDAQLVTVVRDPLKRAISQYFFVRETDQIKNTPQPEWATGDELSMPLEEYLLTDGIRNMQSRFLDPYRLDDYAIIGVTETLGRFCRNFQPRGRISLPRINHTIWPKFELDPNVKSKFTSLNTDDYALYKVARIKVGLD